MKLPVGFLTVSVFSRLLAVSPPHLILNQLVENGLVVRLQSLCPGIYRHVMKRCGGQPIDIAIGTAARVNLKESQW